MRRFVTWGLVVAMLTSQSATLSARDVLLIDNGAFGFGGASSLLAADGHTVTQITGESTVNGFGNVSNPAFLSNYDFVVYSIQNQDVPDAAIGALNTYIQNGGDLLVTGFSVGADFTDRSEPELIRALGPEYAYPNPVGSQTVTSVNNYITNGLHGDFRGSVISPANGTDQLFANTGLGTIPIIQQTSGQPDKAIFTDLAGAGGSVGAWQGNLFGASDFYDGGVYQNVFLNWAAGGTTTQTEKIPVIHASDLHSTASTLTFEFYLGDPSIDGTLFLGSLSSLEVTATADVVGSLDSGGNGSVALTELNIDMAAFSNRLLDMGGLGTVLVDLNQAELYVGAQPADVTGNAFDIAGSSDYYVLGITKASIRIHSPTGLMATVLGGDGELIEEVDEPFYGGPLDFPQLVLNGTYDQGPGLLSALGEVNLSMDRAGLELVEVDDGVYIWIVVRGDLHLAAVPEPSSLLLAALGLVSLLYWNRRRAKSAGC